MKDFKMLGYIAAFTGAIFVSAKDLVSKKLAYTTTGTLSAFASFAFAIPYYVLLLAILYGFGLEDFSYKPQFFLYVLLRSTTDVGAEWLKMSALSLGEISLVSQFLALSPLFLIITSPLITSDPITPTLALALLISTLSTFILIYRKKGTNLSSKDKKAILLAIGSAFFFSLNSAFDRLAVQEASATFSAFAMTFLSGLILLPINLLKNKNNILEKLYENKNGFFLRGFFEVIFMIFKMIALKYLQAPIVIIIQRFSLLFTILGGAVIYKEKDIGKRLFAGSLILLSGILILI